MSNIQMACYMLIGSAFILAGLLLVQLQGHITQSAQAELVISRQNFTVMTSPTKNDEEALFVLNNTTNRLLIYTTELRGNRGTLNLVANADMARLFQGQAGGEGGGGGRRQR